MGEVRSRAACSHRSMSIIEALARAGSTTEHAGTDAVILGRRRGAPADAAAIERAQNSNDSDVVHVNLQNLQGALSRNVELRPGDTIFVPRAESSSCRARCEQRVIRHPQAHDRATGVDACWRRVGTWVHAAHPDHQERQRRRHHGSSDPSRPGPSRRHHRRPRGFLLSQPRQRVVLPPDDSGYQ